MKKIIAFIALVAPSVAFAQTKVVDVNSLSTKLSSIGNVVVYLLVALAVIFIVWNTVIYVIKGSGEEGRSKAGMNILWGIVGLFVIVSIWGLVNILTNTFSTTATQQPLPNFGNNTTTGGMPGNNIPGTPPTVN